MNCVPSEHRVPMPSQMSLQRLATQAFTIALQHPAIAADQRNICTLLQVSRAWRAAIQQSAASTTHCTFQVHMSLDQLNRLVSFTGWLAKYAGLINTLNIGTKVSLSPQDADTAALLAAMKQLIEFGLQVAASRAGAPLRLQSYTSVVPATAGLLAALPAATLTYLDLRADNSNWFAPLGTLSNLRQLRLEMGRVEVGATNSCLREIRKLRQLTQLQLLWIAVESDMRYLPVQLQQLQLEYQGWSDADDIDAFSYVNLRHLTSLQHLELRAANLAARSCLPPNLQSLVLQAQWLEGETVGIPSLHKVTAIELTSWSVNATDLEPLQHLPQLKQLSLHLEAHIDPLVAAPAWPSLPLDNLKISAGVMDVSQLHELVQHVAAVTRLTALHIRVEELEEPDGNEDVPLEVCEQLKALTNLKSLTLNIGHPDQFVRHDTQHLSALSTLTSLELCSTGFGPAIDEATLCLLAVALTNLRELSVNMHGEDFDQQVQSITALPAIGRLTNLEALCLQGMNVEDACRGLQFLTGLSRLTKLGGFDAAGEAALQEFWATVRQQQQEH